MITKPEPVPPPEPEIDSQPQTTAESEPITPVVPTEVTTVTSPKPIDEILPKTSNKSDKGDDTEDVENKKDDERADSTKGYSTHEDSDFEDNITVTVPPPHLQSGNLYRDRHLNGRHGRHLKHSGGMETSPKNPTLQVSCRLQIFIIVAIFLCCIYIYFIQFVVPTQS